MRKFSLVGGKATKAAGYAALRTDLRGKGLYAIKKPVKTPCPYVLYSPFSSNDPNPGRARSPVNGPPRSCAVPAV
jgi:hypothetical protein